MSGPHETSDPFLADWLSRQRGAPVDTSEADAQRDRLADLPEAERAAAMAYIFAGKGDPTAPTTGMVWSGEPRAVRQDLLATPPFDVAILPEPLRPWIADVADRLQCPVDFAAVGAMVSLAMLAGRKVTIRPKRRDDWTVVPNLWGAVVGRPGLMKTPALTEALRPLRRLEAEARESHEAGKVDRIAAAMEAAARAAAAKKALEAAARKGDDPINTTHLSREAARAAADLEAASATAGPKRYTTSDATVEKWGELLRDNTDGMGLIRDELTGWIKGMEREGREGERAFYIEGWNGGEDWFTFDRIGRGTVYVPNPTISVLGSIQPGPLKSLLRGGSEDGGDGFVSRLQLLVWPDDPKDWRNVDRWPDSAARDRAHEVYRSLDSMTPDGVGAEADPGGRPAFLRFADDAQELFDAWRTTLEAKIREPGITPAIESHLSKYRSLMPSLALLSHLADRSGGPVTSAAAARAAAWCDYLEAHARRAYECLTHADIEAGRTLASRIEAGKLPSPFTVRDVYRRCWSGLDKPDDARRAVASLEELGWLKTVEVADTGGAPKEEIHIHPSKPRTPSKNP